MLADGGTATRELLLTYDYFSSYTIIDMHVAYTLNQYMQ